MRGSKLYDTIRLSKERVVQQSRQRRGGVTDLFGIDYTDEIKNDGTGEGPTKHTGIYYMTVSGDLDRFQRWFFKVIVINNVPTDDQTDVIPLSQVNLSVSALNETTGKTAEIDLTPYFKKAWGCNWIGDSPRGEGIFPNAKPMEGFDLMEVAWYLNNDEREALFSPGEKIFYIRAIGDAKVTIRNYLKFSHIN